MTTSSLATGFDEEQLLTVLTAFKDGDFTRRMPTGGTGTAGKIAETVNALLDNVTGQVRNIAETITAIANGDLTKKVDVEMNGEMLELKITINIMVDQLNTFASEVTHVARDLGNDGRFGVQADVKRIAGSWKDLLANINFMSAKLTDQLRDISSTAHGLIAGDTSQRVTVLANGETLDLKEAINKLAELHVRREG